MIHEEGRDGQEGRDGHERRKRQDLSRAAVLSSPSSPSRPSSLRHLLPLIAAALLTFSTGVRTDDPVSSNVRYTGEIVRIFDRKCAPCHGGDGVGVGLTNYREVRDWARAIREEIVEQRMPPWSAARGYTRFRNDLALTTRETTTILSWLDGGMPRGDDRDLPQPLAAAHDDPPDLLLRIPPQQVPAGDDHAVRRVTVDIDVAVPRRVARVVVAPDHRGVLRGALVFIDGPDHPAQWIGSWLPWQSDAAPPASHAFELQPRSRLAIELHYRGADADLVDAPSLGIYFANETALPTEDLLVRRDSALRIATATTAWAIVPAADGTARSLELTARRPNGVVDVLVWMPEIRRDWPQVFVLDDPARLPAGTTLSLDVQPRTATATARLSLLSAAGASRASRLQIRTPAPPRR